MEPMDDAQLEDLLRRVQPAGPPPGLRARVAERRRPLRAWPWVAAAAALLVITAVLQASAERARASFRLQRDVAVLADAVDSEALRDALGLDDVEFRAEMLRRELSAIREAREMERHLQ
jgi:hypothetical protein